MISRCQNLLQKTSLFVRRRLCRTALIAYQTTFGRSFFAHQRSLSKNMDNAPLTNSLSTLSVSDMPESSLTSREFHTSAPSNSKGKAKAKGPWKKNQPKGSPSQSSKLRGMDKDSPEVRLSKTLTWLLRHGAQNEGLHMRADGYVRVTDILNHPKLKPLGLDLDGLQDLVKTNDKQRYELIQEPSDGLNLDSISSAPVTIPALEVGTETPNSELELPPSTKGIWWIRATQGHSIKNVQLEMKPILSLTDIPTGIAVHGTNHQAWQSISKTGLSKMKRNHIHIAQDVAGQNVVSGMRTTSQVLIYIDVPKAIEAGIKFWLSGNGVILTEGDENGFLSRKFFQKVVDLKRGELHGWEE